MLYFYWTSSGLHWEGLGKTSLSFALASSLCPQKHYTRPIYSTQSVCAGPLEHLNLSVHLSFSISILEIVSAQDSYNNKIAKKSIPLKGK